MVSWTEEICAALAEEGDPRFAAVDDAGVEHAVRVGAAEIAAATCRWLLALAEFVRRGLWADQGARTPAEWLSWAVSMGTSTAREHIRVALALRRFPKVEAAFAAGRVSYTKVRAITRYARPELEDLLLAYCEYATGAQIETILRGLDRATTGAAPVDPQALRGCDCRWDDDGMLQVRLRLAPEEGVGFLHLLDTATDQLFRQAIQAANRADASRPAPAEAEMEDAGRNASAGVPPRSPQRSTIPDRAALRADALVAAVAHMGAELPDDDGSERHLVVIHVAAESLAAPDDGADPRVAVRAGNRNVPAMSVRAIRRLACHVAARTVVHDADGDEHPGRARRRPTPRQRRLLAERDRGCRFPGCPATRGLHAHHIVHWIDGGPTDLSNLVLVCGYHHRFVHDRGWKIVHDGAGRFRFHPPDAPPVPTTAPLPAVPPRATVAADPDHPTSFDPHLLQPDWDGLAPDYDLAVAVLCQEIERLQPPANAAVAA